jgi:hypothetical protein
LKNNIHVPFSLKAVYELMLAKLIQSKICWIGSGREGELDNIWVIRIIETSVGGGECV